MLDLQPRVHLEEVEPRRVAVALEQELDRARIAVADRARGRDGRARRCCARSRPVTAGDGRFLDHLLVPPLDRALALEEMDDVAVRIGEDLDLDVSRALDPALDVQRAVAECGLPLPAGPPGSPRRALRRHAAVRMPLPPPPAEALTRTGNPIASPAAAIPASV